MMDKEDEAKHSKFLWANADREESLKFMVKDNKKVTFQHYRQGNLYYKTETGFTFPVPISDAGEATFLAEDRALYFMRYIRISLLQRSNDSNIPK